MAEVYGVKPKMFTKEWWPYFWMYYKWHTVIAVIAIFGIAMGIYQKATEVKYDLNLTYMAQNIVIGENGEQELIKALEPKMSDANGDGEVHLYIDQINITGDEAQIYLDMDLRTKHDMEFGNEFSYLFVYDAKEFQFIDNSGNLDEAYIDISEWAGDIGEKAVLSGDGGTYGVSLKDSKIMKQCGIDSDDLYVFIKNDSIDKEKNKIAEENAIILAKELIK